VCKVTGKRLPHKAQRQYLSRHGRHIPRARAQRGDTIYWARHGSCLSGIRHIAIVKDERMMIHATGHAGKVLEQRIWTESGRLKICPYAVRFGLLPPLPSSSLAFSSFHSSFFSAQGSSALLCIILHIELLTVGGDLRLALLSRF
jgi:hypothetical protein